VSSEDKAFMAKFVVVLAALVLFAVVMFLIARLISSTESSQSAAKSIPQVAEAIKDRIRPVVTMQDLNTYNPGAAASEARPGEGVYGLACQACHATGVLGAPKMGDGSAWGARLEEKGFDKLVNHAINGINAMPARGGNPSLSDTEIKRAIDYMLTQSGVDSPYQEGSSAPAAKPSPAGTQAAAPSGGEPAPAETEASTPQAGSKEEPVATPPAQTAQPTGPAESGGPERLAKGENRYKMVCAACHNMGVAGAPKLGDKAAWEGRLTKGIDGLMSSVINGKGAMPPRGGAMNYSNDDVRAAIEYMVSKVN
jgi:cytochrome c5